MRLVLVHGIAQQGKDASELKRVWLEALDVGLAKAGLASINQYEVILPFYGDKLAELTALLEASGSIQLQTKGVEAAPQFDRTEAEMLQEILATQLASAENRQTVTTKGFQNTAAALALARAADRTPFGAHVLARFVKDVSAYLTHARVTQKIDEIVQPAIGTEHCVVVGHSLGSVVAFRILREMGRAANVERFITLGSPLGLNTIRNLITPPPLETPTGVRSWINAFDPADVVSLHPLDKSTWNVNPAIVNFSGVNNHTSNHHGISGYLDDGQVAAAVHEALSR
ncbi:MAG: hypothetical protein Q8S71_04560 [Hydrogenophaga sp.]|nr:hypothetical protein [Hydrogenophaga sp.]MDP3322801.1 hypothetical protein [Hydrogenophaga sp.]